ncbi:MAG: aminoacyl-histidine dipeptidase [Phycisphaerae bacterium]|nr:aminoacyl-histidine dipeptidase [Phycisphaerae bacterium]
MSNQPESTSVESLKPETVWRLFAGIAATPRPSKHEGKIRRHVRTVAEQHGLSVREDPTGNMVIEVPATRGHENVPITVLQGHLDMVPEKNSGTEHDFENDPIKLIIDRDPSSGRPIVRADGTTLGADNGIGVALAMAAAIEPGVVHGPLEILCTIDEEMGMTGAKALTPDFFRGRRLVNLDSEEDDAIYIGCAGGLDTNLVWDFDVQPAGGGEEACRVAVSGLRGGHSGGDIHENRGNAIKLLTRTLVGAGQEGLRIATITGGSKRNAIPREASAVVRGPTGTQAALKKTAETVRAEVIAESFDDKLNIAVEGDEADRAMTAQDTSRFLAALTALPSGVLGMHPKVDGLVQTSNNLSTVVPTANGRLNLNVGMLTRSSSRSLLHVVAAQLAAIGRLAGATIEQGGEYPGWEPNVDSPILATCRRVYETLFGEEPKVMAVHGGLECGVISERVGGKMDTVSFGPTIKGAHSPDERVYVESVQKSWKYLVAVLAELAKG